MLDFLRDTDSYGNEELAKLEIELKSLMEKANELRLEARKQKGIKDRNLIDVLKEKFIGTFWKAVDRDIIVHYKIEDIIYQEMKFYCVGIIITTGDFYNLNIRSKSAYKLSGEDIMNYQPADKHSLFNPSTEEVWHEAIEWNKAIIERFR